MINNGVETKRSVIRFRRWEKALNISLISTIKTAKLSQTLTIFLKKILTWCWSSWKLKCQKAALADWKKREKPVSRKKLVIFLDYWKNQNNFDIQQFHEVFEMQRRKIGRWEKSWIVFRWFLTCSWHQKTKPRIQWFTNLKCFTNLKSCIKAREPFKTPF